jgi:hypothetical protein
MTMTLQFDARQIVGGTRNDSLVNSRAIIPRGNDCASAYPTLGDPNDDGNRSLFCAANTLVIKFLRGTFRFSIGEIGITERQTQSAVDMLFTRRWMIVT